MPTKMVEISYKVRENAGYLCSMLVTDSLRSFLVLAAYDCSYLNRNSSIIMIIIIMIIILIIIK